MAELYEDSNFEFFGQVATTIIDSKKIKWQENITNIKQTIKKWKIWRTRERIEYMKKWMKWDKITQKQW